MAMQMPEITLRPVHRIAQELARSNGFLLARLGMGFKAKAIARAEEAGFELYDYSVLAILDEGVRETQSTIAATLSPWRPARKLRVCQKPRRRPLRMLSTIFSLRFRTQRPAPPHQSMTNLSIPRRS